MLTENEQQRIIEEEVFRNEIRNRLSTPSATFSKKLLDFINKPFFIFFCSSVLISSISYLYAKHQDDQKIAIQRLERKIKLRRELSNRVATIKLMGHKSTDEQLLQIKAAFGGNLMLVGEKDFSSNNATINIGNASIYDLLIEYLELSGNKNKDSVINCFRELEFYLPLLENAIPDFCEGVELNNPSDVKEMGGIDTIYFKDTLFTHSLSSRCKSVFRKKVIQLDRLNLYDPYKRAFFKFNEDDY